MSYFETNQPLRADVATLRWAADRLDAQKIEPDHVYGVVLAIQALRGWADEMAQTGPGSPLAAVPAPVQGADPTGPQTAHSGDDSTPCGAVIRIGDDMVDCSYDEGHSGDHLDATGRVAWSELGLRLPDPWADAEPAEAPTDADGANGRPCACPCCSIVIVSGDSAFCDHCRCETVDDLREELRTLLVERDAIGDVLRGAQDREQAERERADKAEAENSRMRDDILRLQHALNVMAMWEIRAGQATERADKAEADRDALLGALALAEDAISYVDPSDKAEFYARLAELRAGAEEAQS